MTRADKLAYIQRDVNDARKDFYTSYKGSTAGSPEHLRLERLKQLRAAFVQETTDLGMLLPYPETKEVPVADLLPQKSDGSVVMVQHTKSRH